MIGYCIKMLNGNTNIFKMGMKKYKLALVLPNHFIW